MPLTVMAMAIKPHPLLPSRAARLVLLPQALALGADVAPGPGGCRTDVFVRHAEK